MGAFREAADQELGPQGKDVPAAADVDIPVAQSVSPSSSPSQPLLRGKLFIDQEPCGKLLGQSSLCHSSSMHSSITNSTIASRNVTGDSAWGAGGGCGDSGGAASPNSPTAGAYRNPMRQLFALEDDAKSDDGSRSEGSTDTFGSPHRIDEDVEQEASNDDERRDGDDAGDGPAPATKAQVLSSSSTRSGGSAAVAPADPLWPDLPPGARVYADGRDAGYKQTGLARVAARLTLLCFLAWVPYTLSAVCVWACLSRVGLAVAAVLFLGGLLSPAGPLFWVRFLNNPVFRLWRGYFNYSLVLDSHFDLNGQYVYAMFPHGVWPLSQLIAVTSFKQFYKGHRIYSLVANCLFAVPIWRHIMIWIGAAPATPAGFRRLLKLGSVAVLPDGIAGMYMQHPHKEQIKLGSRTGFVRLSVEQGVDIIPVYHFGNSRLMDWSPRSMERLCRRWRAAAGFLTGVWGLPIPRQVPLMMVVGAPIPVRAMQRGEAGFEEEVQRLHEQLQVAMLVLYNRYRRVYDASWENRPLEIM